MSETLTTELEAVNIILGAIGEAPVNTLSGTLPVDVNSAVACLAEVRKEVCEMGWQFNTEEEVQTSLNEDDEVILATNILKCEPTYPSIDLQLVQRGVRLYDRKNHTYTFTQAPQLNITYLLTWAELPEVARAYIAHRAARKFQQRQMGSPELDAVASREEMDALAKLKSSDSQTANYNIFQSPDMARLHLYRRR